MRFSLSGVSDALTFLPAGVVFKAAKSTVAKVQPAAVTAIAKEIQQNWNVPRSEIDKRVRTSATADGGLTAVITVGGRSVSLSYFSAMQMKGAAVITRKGTKIRKRGKFGFQGVSVTIEKSKTTLLHSAFMQKMKSGHVGIFVRTGQGRYPIRHKDSISLASMVKQARVNDPVVARIEERMATIFPRELEFYAGRDLS
jgi:hypothetical protein